MLSDNKTVFSGDTVSTRTYLLICSILCLLTVCAYWNVFHSDFINYDDPLYLLDRPQVWGGLTAESMRWALSSTVEGNWIPLTWLSYLLDVTLFGVNARAHHAVNLLFHLLNTLLLLIALRRLTGYFWRSTVVAALFALHPLHVESVAWIAERKDVLCGFFFMLTLLVYHFYTIKPCIKRYIPVLLIFFLGLLSKSMLVTMPFLLLLLDYWPLNRRVLSHMTRHPVSEKTSEDREGFSGCTVGEITALPQDHCSATVSIRQLVAEKIPLLLVALLSIGVTFAAQKQVGAMTGQAQSTVLENLANALVSYVVYIYKTVFPSGLAVVYPYPVHIPFWQPLLAVSFLSVVTFLIVRCRNDLPYLMTGWFWFLGMLVPVIGLVRLGNQATADRYTYLPLIGLFVMAVWGSADYFLLKKNRVAVQSAVVLVVLGIMCVLTSMQVGCWKNSVVLFRHAADVTEDNWLAYEKLASALSHQRDFQQAMKIANESIRINPTNPDIYIVIGIIYNNLGKRDMGSNSFRQSIQLNPGHEMAHLFLGRNLMLSGDTAGAMMEYYALNEINPQRAEDLLKDITQIRQMLR